METCIGCPSADGGDDRGLHRAGAPHTLRRSRPGVSGLALRPVECHVPVMAITDTTGVPLPAGSILGTRVLRTEDPGFLTTGATYTDDLVDERLAGAVHATFVRSPVAHARIESIDVSGAMDMPGVVAVLTADELGAPDQRPMMPMYPKPMMQPLLARDVVRYVGEPVAVVLTEERYQGEDAAEL